MDGAVVVVAVVVLGRILTAGVRLTRNGFSVLKRKIKTMPCKCLFLFPILRLLVRDMIIIRTREERRLFF